MLNLRMHMRLKWMRNACRGALIDHMTITCSRKPSASSHAKPPHKLTPGRKPPPNVWNFLHK